MEQVFQRMEQKLKGSASQLKQALAADAKAVDSKKWFDIGGQLLPRARFESIAGAVTSGEINSIEKLRRALQNAHDAYDEDVWLWSRNQIKDSLGVDLDNITADQARELAERYSDQQQKFLRLVLIDAEREYDDASRIGFGIDGDAAARDQDFAAVRGKIEENSFVKQLHADIAQVAKRCEAIRQRLSSGS